MNSSNKTTFYAVLILLLSIITAVLLIWTEPKAVSTTDTLVLPKITQTTVIKTSLQPNVRLTGRLVPSRKARLSFELAGRVSERLVESGFKVKSGQKLLTLEDGDYRDAYVDATAQHTLEQAGIQRDKKLLELARYNEKLQRTEVRRLIRLGKGSLVSKSRLGETRQKLLQLQAEVARLEYSVNTAQARLKLKQSAMERARRNLDRTRLTAPFAGTINKVMYQKGDYVTSNQVAVEIVSDNQLELYLQVSNKVVSGLKKGQEVKVKLPDKTVNGVIFSRQPDPNDNTFTHPIRIRLPKNIGEAGMFPEVILPLKPLNDVMAVPVTAVVEEQGAAYVMVVSKENRISKRSVKLGARVGNLRVIKQGLSEGERVVTRDIVSLNDGQRVEVVKSKNSMQ